MASPDRQARARLPALIDAQTRAGDRSEDETMRQVLKIQEDYLASVGPQSTPAERLAQARVIAGTCAGVQGNQEVRERTFALAVLEEAGKATPPEALMLVLRAKQVRLRRRQPPAPAAYLGPDAHRSAETRTAANPNPDRARKQARSAARSRPSAPPHSSASAPTSRPCSTTSPSA